MNATTYRIERMDCASEEQLVRMKLEQVPDIRHLSFDLQRRELVVQHEGPAALVSQALDDLDLGSQLVSSEASLGVEFKIDESDQRALLVKVLIINGALFLIEIVVGFLSNSMGLVADSLDMLADAIIYSLSLYAVGRAAKTKLRIAKTSGVFQLMLAIFGLAEVLRRAFGAGETPAYGSMIVISLLALAGNVTSAIILNRSRSSDPHMRASVIFTSNDVYANIGVIIAGILVFVTASRLPDLVIGTLIFLLVARGARSIMKLQ